MRSVDGPNFRQAHERDRERLIELEGQGYPFESGQLELERAIFHNPLGELRDFHVGTLDDDIVCQAFLFRLRAYFGGARVKMGGIASVAVAAEARGRGAASGLMDHLHSLARRRGMPITMLYAFRQGFYTRLGYAPCSSRKRLVIDARAIPRSWNAPVRRARGADRRLIERLHREVARTMTGVHERPKALWDLRLARPTRIILVTDGGYLMFEIRQEVHHTEAVAVVDELVATTLDARRALLGALGRMRDQVSSIEYEVAENDPIELALIDPDGHRYGDQEVEHDLGRLVGGPLVRLTDVELGLTARGYHADGAFTVALDDRHLGVQVKGGVAALGRPRGPELATGRATLGALLYGGLGLREAVRLGLARIDAKALARVDSILRLPPILPLDPF